MPHIHTDKNQHDVTATAYIVRTDGPEPKALLHMHRKLQMLLPVGGHVELSENPWQAIAHELTEESGYTISQLAVLQPPSRIKSMKYVVMHPVPLSMNTHPMQTDHFHTDMQFAFVAENDPENTANEGESNDLRWLTRNELDAVPNEIIFDNTRTIYQFILNEALPNWDRVATSEFSLELPNTTTG